LELRNSGFLAYHFLKLNATWDRFRPEELEAVIPALGRLRWEDHLTSEVQD
jgi:hypothetical protein